jgi:hypothetical protein
LARMLHSRMPLVPTPVCLKLLQACDQYPSSRVSAFLPIHATLYVASKR